ncbi:efflux RND transporter periplasmic adaptor subunit [Olivibacter sp. SDN3]|uniref:efflux RND transporter periplasmic adaptor subunit n=1 Tax=Olivibacter sp. SDN3 TaxID=2764720 RepID=UPI001650E68D|nr:efflux RND transporter periplasmic adaptor subunit [Olivibacter sp. SDN3]QNL47932.1 efflux RND transporter periplasmic adaptor subunit [Olivibacter sp. SDN3]
MIYSLFFLLAVACQTKPSTKGGAEATERRAEEKEEGGALEIFQSQLEALGAELGTVELKHLSEGIQAVGFIRVHNQHKAAVTSLFGGRIQHILVAPGDIVKKGQVLASVVNPQLIVMQEEYLTLVNALALTKLERSRQEELVEGNAGALKNFQQVETQLKQQQVRIASLERQLALAGINVDQLTPEKIKDRISITAPASGTVSQLQTELGANADAGAVLANIVDNDQVDLDLYIYEKDLSRVKVGQEVEFSLSNDADRKGKAVVDRVGSSFEGENKAVAVHARITGDRKGYIDGMGVTALLGTETSLVAAVPNAAIVDKDGNSYVFALLDTATLEQGGKREVRYLLERKQVKKGTSAMGFTQVTSIDPLQEKSRVVISGAIFLQGKLDGGNAHGH